MKTKIVLWGKTEADEKVLVAIELVEAENVVRTHLIKEEDATEIFYNRMLNEWRFSKEMELPEGTVTTEKSLTLTEEILPEGLKVDRPDLIIRAKTEWHFVVLSKKLYDLYYSELEDFREKINEMTEFDSGLWEELKGFWSKVQGQIREKNLFRNHVENLRKETDQAFSQLKDLKRSAEKEIREESKKHFASFSEIMDKVEEKIEGGLGLQPIFEELKDIQNDFKKTTFSREHRRQMWDRIDKAFKTIKQKRYGGNAEDRSPLARLKRRYEGLLSAIQKMEKSIARDKKDIQHQDKKSSSSFGQLEMEIRKVKMSMVEERIQSKEEKLTDMMKTKSMLENRIKNEEEKEQKRILIEKAKKEAEEKIAREIQDRNEELGDSEEELKKAAEMIQESKEQKKEKKESKKEEEKKEKSQKEAGFMDKISGAIGGMVDEAKEIAEDVVDTVKAVAEVVEEKAEKKMDELEDKMEEIEDKVEEKTAGMRKKFSEMVDKVEDKMEEVEDKIEEKIKNEPTGIGAKLTDAADKIEDKFDEAVDSLKEKLKDVMHKDEEE